MDLKLLRLALVTGALAFFAVGASAGPSKAEDGRNAAAIAGAIGGLAAGAAVGAHPGYRPAPVYRERHVVDDDEECTVRVRRSWDGYGWRTRRVTVCE